MLSDEVIEKVTERLVQRIEQGNEYILNRIGSNIKKIRSLSPTRARELAQILKYGGDYDKIVLELSRITELNEREIEQIFDEVAKKDYTFAKQFYDYRGIKYIPYEENIALRNEVKALAEITKQTYRNLSNTRLLGYITEENGKEVFKDIRQTYVDLVDESVLNVSQGKETFNETLSRQIKAIGNGGLRVQYKSGYTRRLDSAIRMNIKDSIRQLHNNIQEEVGKAFDSDGVEISVHLNPAPDHAEVQGRQFSKDEFNKFQNDIDSVDYQGKLFPAEFDGHDRRSISEYNCYHYVFSIVLGVNKPQYSNEKLKEIIDRGNQEIEFDGKKYNLYECSQLQRKLETEIRKAKDEQILARASETESAIQRSQKRIRILTDKYKKLSDISGLPVKKERFRVSGYHSVGKRS